MLFNSLSFLIFFPVVAVIYFVVPNKIKNLWLLAASYFFYMCWNAKYAVLLLLSTGITYISGWLMEKIKCMGWAVGRTMKYKKIVVAMSFILNLSILFYFKYIGFAVDSFCQLLKMIHVEWNSPVFDIVLPVGISFYTFQALSYTMDVYRDEIYAEKNFFQYALFVSFFPQLVAGPIERSRNLLKQLARPEEFSVESVRGGYNSCCGGTFSNL